MSNKRRRRPAGRSRPAPRRPAETVTIEKIAQQGDGEARLADGTRVFVPLTLPGDEVRVQPGAKRGDGVAGGIVEDISRQPQNSPICDVYGTCGGCQLQHLPQPDYLAWKRDVVATALRRHGLETEIAPLRQVPLSARRRATLSLVMTQDGPVLGFNAAYSDRIVGMNACPLLNEPLSRIWEPLRAFCNTVFAASSRADIALTAAGANSLEVVITTDLPLDLEKREAIASFAEAQDIARICWQPAGTPPEPVVQRRPVLLHIGPAEIELPMGGFLQPSAEGEAILQALVMAGVGDCKHVADLYAGVGTFAFVLAATRKHVLAVDDNAAQIAALGQAAGRAGLGGYVRTEVRDLRSSPLSVQELDGLDAVIFDPPRAGAKMQAECLADSDVETLVAVSCNPATLARDLRALVDGGYRIQSLTPVDQFPMSYHVEAVAVLRRHG